MHLCAVDNQIKHKSISQLLFDYILVLTLGFLLGSMLLSSRLVQYKDTCHIILVLGSILISFSSSFIIWQIYKHISTESRILGIICFVTTVFKLFFICYFPSLDLHPTGYGDFFVDYWIIGSLAEIILLLYLTYKQSDFATNKVAAYGISAILAATFSTFLLNFPELLQTVFYTGKYGKIFIQSVLIFVIIATLRRLLQKVNNHETILYRYIFAAFLIKIAIYISCFFVTSEGAFLFIYAHILDVFYAYYLLRGIFESTVTYPCEKLETAEKYLVTILDALPIGILTYDQRMRLSFINRKAQNEFGFRAEEFATPLAAEDGNKSSFKNHRPKPLVEQFSETSSSAVNDIMVIRNDLGDEVKLQINACHLGDLGYLYIFDDAKHADELKNLRLQTEIILNSIDNIVLIVDKKGKILACNRAFEATVEMPKNDVIGMDLLALSKLLRIERKKPATQLVGDSLGQNISDRYEATMYTAMGNKKYVVFYLNPIHNIDGEVIGAINVASDITSLKLEQEKMQQHERLVLSGQVAAGIVHEIKNPLTTIKGFSQLIISKANDEKTKKYASMIEAATNDLNRIVTSFLEFARPKPPVFGEIALVSFIESIKVMLLGHAFAKGVDINFDLTSEKKIIMADETKLKQVILNIVRNAIDAMAGVENPRLGIKVQYNALANEMRVVITDNGKGMSAEDREKLGTPFYTTKEKGTGLGLSICYQIMKEHKGDIDIQSEIGKGTAFTLSFPCIEGV